MLLKKRKTEEFHFTPEQEACLAKCRELTNDALRILNGGGSYKGMPSSVQMQQGLSGDSSDDNSNSSSGTSKGHNGMPSDVEAMLEHSGSSSVTETSSSAGQTTVISVTYPTETATQPSAPKPTESEPAVKKTDNPTATGSYPGKIAGEMERKSPVCVQDPQSEKTYPNGEKDRTESFERIRRPAADSMTMQDLKGTPEDEEMYGGSKFSETGCKETAGAKIASEILGEDISLQEVNKADVNEDGLLTRDELMSFIQGRLAEGETIETELLEGSDLTKENMGRLAHPKPGERNYILLHAIGVGYDPDKDPTDRAENHPHWVVGEGYFINSLGQVQFAYDGTSGNDFSTLARSYILSEPFDFQKDNFCFPVVGVEVYTVRQSY